jgi:hypothetical protein
MAAKAIFKMAAKARFKMVAGNRVQRKVAEAKTGAEELNRHTDNYTQGTLFVALMHLQ